MALDWTTEYQEASDDLKGVIMADPVLALPDHTKPFEIHANALNYAIGGVLMQEGQAIAYENRELSDTQRKYTGKYTVREKGITA